MKLNVSIYGGILHYGWMDRPLSIAGRIICKNEDKYQKKVEVKLLNLNKFYLAEEEHQKYSLKNPDEFLYEEIISGRKDYKWIKLN